MDTHHSRHGKGFEEEALTAVAVALKNHELHVMSYFPSKRPAQFN